MNYSELLQLAKGWGNFLSDRIIIWRLLTGYYNEGRCPKCVEAAEQERYRRYWDKGGTLRPMGSTDKCVLCGKEYTVRSSTQRYCSEECRRKESIPKYKETKKISTRTSGRNLESVGRE